MIPNSYKTGSKLENTNLLHPSPPVEFFKHDDFVTKIAEQTNFYAVQKGAPPSFKLVSDGYLIETFTSTPTQTVGEGQRQILDVPYVKLTLWNELLFCSIPCKIYKIIKTKQEKAHCEVNTLFI